MTLATAAVTAAVGAALAVTGTVTPSATTPTTPSVPRLVAAAPVTATAVTYPVESLAGPVEALVFGEGSSDGAVEDLGGKQFRLAADVLFAFDKAALNARARGELATIAAKLKAEGVRGLTVVGFTDSKGTDAYNRGLSLRRAQAVRTALVGSLGAGVSISASGRGELDPVADNGSAHGQALNRRVVITVR